MAYLGGSNFGDTFLMSNAVESASGAGGDDTFVIAADEEYDQAFYGGNGTDTISFAAMPKRVTFSEHFVRDETTHALLAIENAAFDISIVNAPHSTLTGIERMVGTAFDDEVTRFAYDLDHRDDPEAFPTATPEGWETDLTYELGAGNDTFNGLYGEVTYHGGGGTDTLYVSYGYFERFTIDLQAGFAEREGSHATLISIENATGDRGIDIIRGSDATNELKGDDGGDTISGGLGNDKMDGGKGADLVTYAASLTAVTVDLAAGTASGEGNDTLKWFENATGSAFADTLKGTGGKNSLAGGNGNDTLDGIAGLDNLVGGKGQDTFVMSQLDGVDTILDFKAADDTVGVDNAALPGNIAEGGIDANQFVSGHDPVAAQAKSFLYDIDTGLLSYDADGAGGGAAVEVCVLAGMPAVGFADILIV
jgi:Ca2+-binding RTX toxin-like protein